MSEPWQTGMETNESEVWQSPPLEITHPSFPYVEPLLPQSPISEEALIIPPPPPPPPDVLAAASHSVPSGASERTSPLVGATVGLGMGLGCGALSIVLVTGILIIFISVHGGLAQVLDLGRSSHITTSSSNSLQTPLPSQTGGNSGGTSTGNSANTPVPNAPTSVTGANATTTPTLAPGVTPTLTPTLPPGMTPTLTSTTPPSATNTPVPPTLPLSVTGFNPNDHRITFTITTLANTLLHITVVGCGQIDSTYNNYATTTSSGSYSDTVKLTGGCSSGTVTVSAHLNGYTDSTQSVTIMA